MQDYNHFKFIDEYQQSHNKRLEAHKLLSTLVSQNVMAHWRGTIHNGANNSVNDS